MLGWREIHARIGFRLNPIAKSRISRLRRLRILTNVLQGAGVHIRLCLAGNGNT